MGEPMVQEAARPHLKSLAKLATELNDASDRYTKELVDIEDDLIELNLGVECFDDDFITESDWQQRDTGEEDRNGFPIFEHYFTYRVVGFGRHRGGWRLMVRGYQRSGISADAQSLGPPVLLEEKPLVEESRDVRIAAADRIPVLLEKLEKEAKLKLQALAKVTDRKS